MRRHDAATTKRKTTHEDRLSVMLETSGGATCASEPAQAQGRQCPLGAAFKSIDFNVRAIGTMTAPMIASARNTSI